MGQVFSCCLSAVAFVIFGFFVLVIFSLGRSDVDGELLAREAANETVMREWASENPYFDSGRMTGQMLGVLQASRKWKAASSATKKRHLSEIRDLICVGDTSDASIEVFANNEYVGHVSAGEVSIFD